MTRKKWCRPCRRWHSKAAFGRDASTPSGLAYTCRASRARQKAARRAARRPQPSGVPWLPEVLRRGQEAIVEAIDREWLDTPLAG